MKSKIICIAAATVALGFTSAHAHFLWLKRDGNGPAKAYFGE